MKVGIISGYFNPIHTGHLDYIDGAKDRLIATDFVIVNNDESSRHERVKRFMNQSQEFGSLRRYKVLMGLWYQ